MSVYTDLPERIRSTYDITDADDLDATTEHIAADADVLVRTIKAAADSLLATHRHTGIDLTQAPEWLALVRLVYPSLTIEGTGDGHGIYTTGTETGWYRKNGG